MVRVEEEKTHCMKKDKIKTRAGLLGGVLKETQGAGSKAGKYHVMCSIVQIMKREGGSIVQHQIKTTHNCYLKCNFGAYCAHSISQGFSSFLLKPYIKAVTQFVKLNGGEL